MNSIKEFKIIFINLHNIKIVWINHIVVSCNDAAATRYLSAHVSCHEMSTHLQIHHRFNLCIRCFSFLVKFLLEISVNHMFTYFAIDKINILNKIYECLCAPILCYDTHWQSQLHKHTRTHCTRENAILSAFNCSTLIPCAQSHDLFIHCANINNRHFSAGFF